MNKELETILNLKAEYVCQFTCMSQWVNKARLWIGKFGGQQQIICIDKNGGYVHQGSDFMHADENDLFPVRCFRIIRNTEIDQSSNQLPHPEAQIKTE